MIISRMAYYEPISPERIADWVAYREAYDVHQRAASELASHEGARRYKARCKKWLIEHGQYQVAKVPA